MLNNRLVPQGLRIQVSAPEPPWPSCLKNVNFVKNLVVATSGNVPTNLLKDCHRQQESYDF